MREYSHTFAPGEEYAQPAQETRARISGNVVIWTNLLFAVVIIVALLRNQASAVTAIITGALYFASTTTLFLLIASGALTDLIRTRTEAATQRHLHVLQFAVHAPPADPIQAPNGKPALLQAPSYVPPVDDSARREAVAWLMQLYAADGQPDAKKVLLNSKKEQPGRIRVGAPSKTAVEWLLTKRIIDDWGNGYALRPRYFSRENLPTT